MSERFKAIVFENLAPTHLPAVLGYALFGYRILYLRSGWGGAGRVAHRLALKEPLYLRSNPAGDKAFVFTDHLYESVYERHPLISKIQALYLEERIHLVFKKYLNALLEQHFHYLYLGERIRNSLPAGALILFVPERVSGGSLPPVTGGNLPPWNLPFLRGEAVQKMAPSFAVEIPWWFRLRGRALEIWDLLRVFAETFFLLLWKVGFGKRSAPAPQAYPFAIAIVTPAREFVNPFRSYDMLLDGEKIRKDNTLFVPTAHLTPAQRRILASQELAVADLPGRPSRSLFLRLMRAGYRIFPGLWRAPWWIARVCAYSLRDYWIWKGFLKQYEIRHFISYNELSFRPIARNLLLKRHGVQTWYYVDTVNTANLYRLRPGQPPYRQSIWGYLLYDHLISWNESLSQYHRKHHQNVGQYHEVGCLWSEQIRLLKEDRLRSPLFERIAQWGGASGRKVVAVFDSSYHPDSITNYEDGIAFARGIARLLQEMPEICVIWKEKKPRQLLKLLNRDLARAYEELSRLPRLFFTGYEVAPAEVIALSDLVISFPFTSVAVEALGARVKAFYYDPQNKYYGPYDDEVPGLVVHGFAELRRRAEELLVRVTPEAYDRYLEERVLGHLDPYLDGRGLTRFRNLLTQEEKTEVLHETVLLGR